MKDILLIIGVLCFILLYFVLIPIVLMTAPTMEEDDYEKDDLEKTYNLYRDELDADADHDTRHD